MTKHESCGKHECNSCNGEAPSIMDQLATMQELLQEQREKGDTMGEAQALHAISSCYFAMNEYDNALSAVNKSLSIIQELGLKDIESELISNIAQIYNAMGEFDTAIEKLEIALAIQNEINDVNGLCTSIFNMGHLYLQKKDMENASLTWVSLYKFAKDNDIAEVLHELEMLANQLNLPGGNNAWEMLLETLDKKEK